MIQEKMTNRILTPFPILKTDRLILRQLVNTDDKEIFALRSDDNVNRYLDRSQANQLKMQNLLFRLLLKMSKKTIQFIGSFL